jgi:hypothetical protein
MHTISFDKEALNITIYNLYPGLELTTPVYYSNGTICDVSPSQQTDTGTIIEACFGIGFKQKDFKSALLYRLQRKYVTKTDNLSNIFNVFTKDAAMYLLIICDIQDYDHRFRVCLIECTNGINWDEDMLWALYWEYNNQFNEFCDSNIITWLIHGNAAIETRFDVIYEQEYKLGVVLSEETTKYFMEEPIKIDPKR